MKFKLMLKYKIPEGVVNMSKTYITTPDLLHTSETYIGHAYTTVICDAIARYKRCVVMMFFI